MAGESEGTILRTLRYCWPEQGFSLTHSADPEREYASLEWSPWNTLPKPKLAEIWERRDEAVELERADNERTAAISAALDALGLDDPEKTIALLRDALGVVADQAEGKTPDHGALTRALEARAKLPPPAQAVRG